MSSVPADQSLQAFSLSFELGKFPSTGSSSAQQFLPSNLQDLVYSKLHLPYVITAKHGLKDSLTVGKPGGGPEVGHQDLLHLGALLLEQTKVGEDMPGTL